MPTRLSTRLGAIILLGEALLLAGVVESVRANAAIQETATDADRIERAVDAYRLAQHRLPRYLAQLVPNYFPALPEPAWGDGNWDYSVVRAVDRSSPVMTNPRPDLQLDVVAEGPAPIGEKRPFVLRVREGEGRFAGGLLRDSIRGCWHLSFGDRCWDP